jgi:hypothetical protein
MAKKIAEMRILPPFAIARLGSSESPMDNYELRITDPIGARQIVPAETFLIDGKTGEISLKTPPFEVNFRDDKGKIRPISPFLEVWIRFEGDDNLVPLTSEILSEAKLSPADVKWNVDVANIKAFRRTGDANDRVEATTGNFSNHDLQPLKGTCHNFLKGKSIPFGFVQYVKPSAKFPQIRLRFTPAAGKVYGPPPDPPNTTDPNIADAVYNPQKGWKGYIDPTDFKKDPIGVRKATNPSEIYAGETEAGATSDGDSVLKSYGYLDDECDGIVEVELKTGGKKLSAYARIVAGPPTFAPDSMPVRTVGDELEQAMFGPDLEDEKVTAQEMEDVRDIVRHALETIRLMNTAQMNLASIARGVGMARMDALDVKRALEPIVDPTVADSLAIRARHERVLLALESGSLAWFARVLRNYDEVGDLSDEKRRKMPALMRSADGRHLALTRRQVNKVRAAAEYYINLAKSI